MNFSDPITMPLGVLALFVLAALCIGVCLTLAISTPWRSLT